MRTGDVARIDEDGLVEALHLARGAPASILRSREAADAISEQRAQAQQGRRVARVDLHRRAERGEYVVPERSQHGGHVEFYGMQER